MTRVSRQEHGVLFISHVGQVSSASEGIPAARLQQHPLRHRSRNLAQVQPFLSSPDQSGIWGGLRRLQFHARCALAAAARSSGSMDGDYMGEPLYVPAPQSEGGEQNDGNDSRHNGQAHHPDIIRTDFHFVESRPTPPSRERLGITEQRRLIVNACKSRLIQHRLGPTNQPNSFATPICCAAKVLEDKLDAL